MKFRAALLALFPLLLAACGSASSTSGTPPQQPQHRPAGVSGRRLWVASISPNADSVPAYLPHVRLPNGKTVAAVYVLAGNNGSNCNPGNPVTRATTYAFNAANGKPLWARTTAGPSRCTTAGPVASGNWVYAAGLDGKIHRYNSGTGQETIGHGWPVRYTTMPDVEKEASTPLIANGRLYVTTSGFIGDAGHYEGHLVSITLSNARTTVFNSLCSNIHRLLSSTPGSANYCPDVRSGFFGRGNPVIDPVTHDVYAATGNGPWNGSTNWGDSIVKLDPAGRRLLDTYTPTDQAYLDQSDLDLGSTGPAILPPFHAGGHTYYLLVQGGKGPLCSSCNGTVLRLLNRDNLSGKHGTGRLGGDLQDIATPGGSEVLTAPAVWHSRAHGMWVFYANDSGVAGYHLISQHGIPRLQRAWSIGQGGTTPTVADGALWVARSGEIAAYQPWTGNMLWHTTDIGSLHWEYPLVIGHRLFMTDQSGHLTAYAITG